MLTTTWSQALLILAALLPEYIQALKAEDFKLCKDAAFCRRGRALAGRALEAGPSSWRSPYSLDKSSLTFSDTKSSFTVPVRSSIYPDVKFILEVRVHEDGVVRVKMDEVHTSASKWKRYDEAAQWALIREPALASKVDWKVGSKDIKATYNGAEIVVMYDPFKVVLRRGGKDEVVLNGDGLLHMEHFREKPVEVKVESEAAPSEVVEGAEEQIAIQPPKPIKTSAWFEGEEDDGYWEEVWKSWTDSKPKGPESLSLDITFPGHSHVYGIPQHAAPLALPATTGPGAFFEDPYRLWNLDVFEYETPSVMSLYGSIPLLHAHSARSTVGVFNAIASETYIDISHPSADSTKSHWISESGILDVFLLPGPTAADIFAQYARLTGTPALPAHWALGYHQCRWNYQTSEDMRSVQKRFDEDDFPMDVLWLDIEYSEGHKYMVWNDKLFPDPVEMVNDISAIGRKVVVIVDPHVKREEGYPVYTEARDNGYFVKRVNGEDYEGWCWPGSSGWVDFFNPGTWNWWTGLFSLEDKAGVAWRWAKSTKDVFIWNDMNEPSVFNGPEITMQKDNLHHGGWEHRDVHNINGMLYQNQTARALIARETPAKRPFVLSRSFFAGSQKYGAIWTGDNMGTWEHMAIGIQMVLADGIAGMTFSGSDVGGFFGNPEPEMLTRWYQVGAFSPFFRAHAHIDTKRREPYLLDEPYKSIVKSILRLRYSLLPVWYTAFREASVNGMPVLRPQYVMFPKDTKGFAVDNQYYVGDSGLLVRPVTEAGVTEADAYLAEDQVYYNYFTRTQYRGSASGKNVTVAAPLEFFPLLIRGGSIIPSRPRPRRSSPLMAHDPFTLTIALDKNGGARGELYLDDGVTYSHERGEFIWKEFKATTQKGSLSISSTDLAQLKGDVAVDGASLANVYRLDNAFAKDLATVEVERIIVLGLKSKPKKIIVGTAQAELEWKWTAGSNTQASELVIKRPGAHITGSWTINIQ
ncbi:hypothetical protein FRB93_008113 [Tulasnella sp. JGI-2019a]|nr:hypothetical protein FRB93_008113 [Tulasnella sp. JGI-2019a]